MWNKNDIWNDGVTIFSTSILKMGDSAQGKLDFKSFETKADLRTEYQRIVGNTDPVIPNMYWQFMHEVQPNDIVVVFETIKENGTLNHLLYGWGRFTSECKIVETDNYPLQRDVVWHLPALLEPVKDINTSNAIYFHLVEGEGAITIKKLLGIDINNIQDSMIQKYINVLKSNHNLILTGAPGTGKTYLAKQIAQAMGCTDNEIGFVQFHPSYDYTDFVEGLRPLNDDGGNVGFERKDGVFKAFCAKALSFNTKYEWLINHLQTRQAPIVLERPRSESFEVTVDNSTLRINGESVTKELFKSYYDGTKTDRWFNTHFKKILDYIDKNYFVVFIIDEINRGEINKIFGELFFSIDPGYRGEKGRVQTQYQNMVEDGDAFKKGFFVPENVYIIGTMNDIDRSVESMDFAFRRRFAFVEVKADENTGMLNGKVWKDDAIKRMNSLNATIEKIEGLSSAYHIGASYFLKLDNYNGDFKQLWKYHLEGLLFEYLRGTQSVGENMRKLEKAYNLNNTAADDSDTDN